MQYVHEVLICAHAVNTLWVKVHTLQSVLIVRILRKITAERICEFIILHFLVTDKMFIKIVKAVSFMQEV